MKKKIVFSILVISSCWGMVQAQQVFVSDNQGRPVTETKFENIIGSPYLNENWSSGIVRLSDGKTFKDVQLKYDMVNDLLLFKGKSGEKLKFTTQVEEFKIDDLGKLKIFRSGFKDANNIDPSSFYEVLYDGGIKLLKRTKKIIIESKGYNSATVTKNVDVNTKYYFIDKNGTSLEFKNSKKGVLDVLKDKNKEITQYIASEKLDLKNDSDLTKVFEYYNK